MPKRGSRAKTANNGTSNEPIDGVGMDLPELDVQEQPEQRRGVSSHQMDIQEFMKTPVRHRSRAAASDSKWDSALAHQFQTPERHRSDLPSLLFSPQTNQFASPGVGLANPDLVPLFQPSPKRTLLSPQQQSGVNSFGNIFQSPVRAGDLQASDFLRFETPSSKPRFGGLFSPSSVRGKRHTPGGQLRQRAVSLEARGWQLGGVPGAAGDGFGDLIHGAEDDQEDLIKDILQSPGPKEVQQAADRGHTRSRSTLAPADTADRGRRLQHPHPHRRALDFSRADTVHQDFHSLTGKRLTRHSSSHAAALGEAAADAADQQEQQQLGDALLQPQLPLIPLDLSECGKHNPNSPFKQLVSTGVTPRRSSRRQQQQQQSGLDAVLTSPRSALDAAMAHITQAAMPTLLQTSNLETLQGLESLGFPLDSADALKGLHPGLLKPAFEALSKGGAAAAAAAGAGTDAADPDAASTMVPLGAVASAAEEVGAMEQQQLPLELLQQQYEQYQQQLQAYEAAVAQNAADGVHDELQEHDDDDVMSDSPQQQQPLQRRRRQQQQADSDSDYEDPQPAAAAAAVGTRTSSRRVLSSKRWNLRPHGKKQYSSAELQPSRRSRRIAGDTPDEVPEEQQQQQETRSNLGSSGRTRKQQSRTAAMQQDIYEQQELEEACSQQQGDQDPADDPQTHTTADEQQQQQQQQSADQEAAEETAVTTADEEFEECEQPRTRASSRRASVQKGRKSSKRQSSKHITDDSGWETEPTDADAAASGLYGLPPVTGLQQLLQAGGLLQLPNGVTVPIGMTPSKGGIALLGPNTPDDMRMAHMTQPYGMPVRSCNCKKSQCLKLYCDCFANNVFCNGCSCQDCRNVESNHTEVIARRSQIQQRDPTAFIAKLAATDADTLANRKGCKCKKSHCLKKYCECFQMGVRCGELCKCSDCRNIEDGTNNLAKKLMPRTLHSAATAAPSTAARLPHQQQYWPMSQGMGGAAAGATPATSGAMGLGSVLVRLPGGPNTPGSGPLMCLPLQSPADQAAVAAMALQGSSSSDQPAAAAARNSSRVAKPLLPQFLQAAAAGVATPQPAAAAAIAGVKVEASRSQDTSAAAAAAGQDDDGRCLLSDEELPTPDQQAALEYAAQITAHQQQHHHALASPASSSGAHSSRGDCNRGRSPARALNLDHVASQEGSVLRSNSLSSPIPALQAFHAAAGAGAGVSPVGRQQSPAAAGSSSAGGALHGSPRAQNGVGSASSRIVKQHRLASTSRAVDCDPYAAPVKQHMLQQQPQQQQGILALVGAAAAAGTAAQGQQQQQQPAGITTRRQLLQHMKQEPDADTAFANSRQWAKPPGRSLQPQALFGGAAMAPPGSNWQHSIPAAAAGDCLITPEKRQSAEVGDGQDAVDDTSPVQPVVLGPNGPTVNLSQRALTTAMNQSVAAFGSNAATVPAAAAAAAAAAAGADESSQAVGMLMTVVDEHGQMQYYFLPSAYVPVVDGGGLSADESSKEQQQQQHAGIAHEGPNPSKQNLQQQQQQHYQLRCRPANPLQGTGLSQLPEDMIIDQPTTKQQQPVAAAAAAVTPTKQQPPSPSSGRCLRSSSNAVNGSSPARTPSKRATPVKRKASDSDEQQDPATAAAVGGSSPYKLQPSPAKMQHRLGRSEHNQQQQENCDLLQEHSSLKQQHQPISTRQVLLSPVKRTKGGGLVVLPPQQQQQQDFGVLSSQEANNTAAVAAGMLSPLQGIPISPDQLPAAAAAMGVVPAAQYLQQQLQQAEEPLANTYHNLQQQQQQEGMQLFVASTADGQQYLLQAPMNTDPARLMQPDGTVDAVCLGALGGSSTLAAVAAAAAGGLSDQQQQQLDAQQFGSPVRPMPLHFLSQPGLQRQASATSGSALSGDLVAGSSGGSSGGRRPRDLGAMSPQQPKVLLSPRDTRTRDGSMFKFSPGCTTVFSPTKPKVGSSPSRAMSMT